MTATPFVALAGVSLAGQLRAEYGGPKWQVYLCKPLTTVLLFLAAVVPPRLVDGRYTAGIAGGLLASLAGDIFLMLPGDQFLAGLLCFLVAHLAYLMAFTAGVPIGQSPWLLLPLGAAAAGAAGAALVRLGADEGPSGGVQRRDPGDGLAGGCPRAGAAEPGGNLRGGRCGAVHGIGQPAGTQSLPRQVVAGAGAGDGHVRGGAGADRAVGLHPLRAHGRR
ncbi:MAG: lysoplasmalogenase [Gemmatimonadetes bacterium]|nr:lysoplasmalogenase [Gemmatimonadota bacterium]